MWTPRLRLTLLPPLSRTVVRRALIRNFYSVQSQREALRENPQTAHPLDLSSPGLAMRG